VRHIQTLSRATLGPLLALIGFTTLGEGSAVAEQSVATNVIEFETRNRSDKGVVRCGLFKAKGWLKDAVQPSIVKIHGSKALCVFKGVPAGEYGISAFHDEDANGKLNTNAVGYPLEEYCASNNARNMFSAPSWSDAKFSYARGTLRLKAVMK